MATDIPSWHEILGVRPGASDKEILQAYRQLSKSCHPDAGGNPGLFRMLTTAKDQLLSGSDFPPQAAEPQADPPRNTTSARHGQWERTSAAHDGVRHGYDPQGRTGPQPYAHRSPGFTDYLARLPAPQTAGGWVATVAAWLIGGGIIDTETASIPILGGLIGLCVFAILPLLAAASAIRARRRRRAWDYFHTRGNQW
jgi:DnaJ domain